MIYDLWRRRGEECAGDALRADPSAAGQIVSEDEVAGVLDYLGLWGDDQVDDELRAGDHREATLERREDVRVALDHAIAQVREVPYAAVLEVDLNRGQRLWRELRESRRCSRCTKCWAAAPCGHA